MSSRVKKTDLLSPLEIAHKSIELRPQRKKEALAISSEYALGTIAANILAARGFRVGRSLKNFLSPSLKEGLPDPAGLKGLAEACVLIRECLKKKQADSNSM